MPVALYECLVGLFDYIVRVWMEESAPAGIQKKIRKKFVCVHKNPGN